MKVSFIIPLYNCLPLTQAMLASLRSTLPAGVESEIILVDDGSTDGTRAWLARLPAPCRPLLNEKNLGFAGACNRGAAAAGGEHLFFLNNDLVLLPGWLEPMLAAFVRFPDAGLVGNVQRDAATGAVDHAGIAFNHKGKPDHLTHRPIRAWLTGYRKVPALTGACCAIRRDVWLSLGGFDEGFVNGGEDIDLCLRAHAQGRPNYIAVHSVVRHHVSASPGRKVRDEQNSYRLMRRWGDRIAGQIPRAWCRHHLATHWEEPRNFPDQVVARMAFFHVLHLRRNPPFAAVAGSREAVSLELARWQQMFADLT
jgi:GT2 family glycosyltransferase